MAYAIVGSHEMKLEHKFRMMALKMADTLSLDDCRKIAYVSAGMDDQVALPYIANFRLHVLTTLESRGLITPTNLDFLEDILRNLQRNDLLQLIEDYKKTREYKKAMKRKKKLRAQNGETCTCSGAILHPSHKDQYEELYAEFLTQFSKLSTSTRIALESNDLQKMKLSFSAVAASIRKLSDTVRKTVSEIDSYNSSSSSSRESSVIASMENTSSSPRLSSSSSEDSQNPIPSKTKLFVPQSEDSQSMPSVSYSSSILTKEHRFVYYRPQCRIPEDSGMATDDYPYSTGTGTSDSGVGDMHNHALSYNALRQLDPACRIRSSHDDHDPRDICQGGDVPRVSAQGYMPLLIPQDKPAENYMKMGDDASGTN